jgi:hypothetical protein
VACNRGVIKRLHEFSQVEFCVVEMTALAAVVDFCPISSAKTKNGGMLTQKPPLLFDI